jgi:hypothetical protein
MTQRHMPNTSTGSGRTFNSKNLITHTASSFRKIAILALAACSVLGAKLVGFKQVTCEFLADVKPRTRRTSCTGGNGCNVAATDKNHQFKSGEICISPPH